MRVWIGHGVEGAFVDREAARVSAFDHGFTVGDGVFETMSHHFHFMSNFRPESWDGKVGAMHAYVIGMGHSKDGNSVAVQVRYRMECIETDDGWKCRHYTITPMMPLPGSLTEIHGDN